MQVNMEMKCVPCQDVEIKCVTDQGDDTLEIESFELSEHISGDDGMDFNSAEGVCKPNYNGNRVSNNPIEDHNFLTCVRSKDLWHICCDVCTDSNDGSLVKWHLQESKNGDSANHSNGHLRKSLHWEEFFGSTIDLTPTLLGIYDEIASSNKNEEKDPKDQSDLDMSMTEENLEDETDGRCYSPSTSPIDQLQTKHLVNKPANPKPTCDTDCVNNVEMESLENKNIDINKKRPLSISSMSSSSTSSLPRRRKKPNLSKFSELKSSSQLDIEKLDNLLFIDDAADEASERATDENIETTTDDNVETATDDNISMCSERKSGYDTDSQISADQVNDRDQTNDRDQCEGTNHSSKFHQSDSNISCTSTNNSTSELTLSSSMEISNSNKDVNVQRSPSTSPTMSSRKSSVSRGGSLKQVTHYVSYVQRVVTELIETERAYVLHLKDITQGYYQYIIDSVSNKMSKYDIDCLFGNILEIYNFSCNFLEQLEKCGMDVIKVAECFIENSEGFVIYAEYCTNYPRAVAVLTKVMCDPQLGEVFKQRQLTLGHSLPVGAFLLKPVQRVLKYHLLLQNILKHYNKSDCGHQKLIAALDQMTNMSHQINEMKRKHEHAVRVQEIQSQLEDYEGEDFTQLGELVLEGSFRMYGVKASRQMFLFEKGVIIAKRKEDGMLSCKAFIPCNTLMLVESISKEPLNFQIVPFDNPKAAHTIHARNLDQKRKWCQEIKRLILDSFSSKIPDNVKDLIIEKLGKSKDEDNYAQCGNNEPGKSHVTTPDYLEKRQRARRKSGPTVISDTSRPQRALKKVQQSKARVDTANSKASEMPGTYTYIIEIPCDSNSQQKSKPLSCSVDNQESESPLTKPKQSVFMLQTLNFQNATGQYQDSETENSLKTESKLDKHSEENIHSNRPINGTKSFNLKTDVASLACDSQHDSVVKQKSADEKRQPIGVLINQNNLDNIPASAIKSVNNITNEDNTNCSAFNNNTFPTTDGNSTCNFYGTTSLGKRGIYASMPVLSTEPLSSPKFTNPGSERPSRNDVMASGLSPLLVAKRIDIKPYFSYNKGRISSSTNFLELQAGNSSYNKDVKQINAFSDTFSNLRKSHDDLLNKNSLSRQFSINQPQPFLSALNNCSVLLQSRAMLNKQGPERFTKGSMSDFSHLNEDPWVQNKPKFYTDCLINYDDEKNACVDTTKHIPSVLYTKPSSQQIEKLNRGHNPKYRMQSQSDVSRQSRTKSLSEEAGSDSRDNLDWIVYANRNSIPISGMSPDEINAMGSKTAHASTEHHVENVLSNIGTSGNYIMEHTSDNSSNNVNNGDSDMSAIANRETCTSLNLLKVLVYGNMSPAENTCLQVRNISRSFSTPDSTHLRKKFPDVRPTSADVLGDVSHIAESEKLVAEMEHYMKRSASSSGSLSSAYKFPSSIPNFDSKTDDHHHRHKNRDSCISSGSASSYDSTGENSSEHQEQGIVGAIKNTITNLTTKFTGKRLLVSESNLSNLSEFSPPNSPSHKQETKPGKLNASMSHTLSLHSKPGQPKLAAPDLLSLLHEIEPGSEAIGSRMANTDLDDYATFSHPDEIVKSSKVLANERWLHYGRFSNVNLSCYGSGQFSEPESKLKAQSQSEARLYTPNVALNDLNVNQSDSAFSIQSVENDSGTPVESPRDNVKAQHNECGLQDSAGCADTFYERRLSEVFSNDDEFRDSAVYCDDGETVTMATNVETPSKPTINIKSFVQKIEEKNRQTAIAPVKVKHKEPGAIIKQRIQSLTAYSEYQHKSSNTSCSISSSTSRAQSQFSSRAQSQSSSRAGSEEKTLGHAALRDHIEKRFPFDNLPKINDRELVRNETDMERGGKLKTALSVGRLDTSSGAEDNLIFMKGWVKELIEKFQTSK